MREKPQLPAQQKYTSEHLWGKIGEENEPVVIFFFVLLLLLGRLQKLYNDGFCNTSYSFM